MAEKMNSDVTLKFAEDELRRYLKRMTGRERKGIEVIADEGVFDVTQFPAYDSRFDDAYLIDVEKGRGRIVGNQPRAALLGVYRFLRDLGCIFVRTGTAGEVLPRMHQAACSDHVTHYSEYRHRGIAIEGAVSMENVLDLLDYAPKAGFNSYFIQFRSAYEFFERWYRHKNNPEIPPQEFDIGRIQSRMLEEIARRGLLYHAVGHGWTAEALGVHTRGWEVLSGGEHELLAEVGGRRRYFKGIPSNTNLCYSDERAQELFAVCVADYAVNHPEIDVLHVWLADDCRNFCECESCRTESPSDWYVILLNRIDRELTARGSNVKIAFLAYCELLWPPVRERIENESRFILMFAPITRSYAKSYSQELDGIGELPDLPAFELNRTPFPKELSRNIAFLRGWQRVFHGDSFLFDYPLMWEWLRDTSSLRIPELIYRDCIYLKKLGLNGMISCQLQRCFFPHGLGIWLMGKALSEGEFCLAAESEKFLRSQYGYHCREVMNFFGEVRELLPLEYLRFELPCHNIPLAEQVDLLAGKVTDFAAKLSGWCAHGPVEERSCFLLSTDLTMLRLLCQALSRKMRGLPCAEQRDALLTYVRGIELSVQSDLDVCYYVTVIGEMLDYDWEEAGESLDNTFAGEDAPAPEIANG